MKSLLCKKDRQVSVPHSNIKEEKLIVLAGNPNVGKSTLFNALTGLKQHTGNWSGKTVASAFGTYVYGDTKYTIADVPGCYSLKSHSHEEILACDTICRSDPDAVVVICDASSVERNLNLVLQICEANKNVIMCVNLVDEAEKEGIFVDTKKLSKELGIPVVRINARKKKGFEYIFSSIEKKRKTRPLTVSYGHIIENAVRIITRAIKKEGHLFCDRYIALRLLENDEHMWQNLKMQFGDDAKMLMSVTDATHRALNYLFENGISRDDLIDIIAINIIRTAGRIGKKCVSIKQKSRPRLQRIADKILTGKISGFLVMLLMLSLIFYITLKGANYPSEFLSELFFSWEEPILRTLLYIGIPEVICDMLTSGGYRVLSWVVAVMLPPMAIFFPLFTILEDVGYLPRVAFNLDRAFKCCQACGKQALTTCMGFGCNAAAVTGARIIDSPRERLLAIATNSFIPCNGRFPSLICLICIFFISGANTGIAASLLLTGFVVLAILMSLFASRLLSGTLLKGMASSFALELPHYRKPQIGKILVRSLLDRTVFVLLRASVVAFPSGIVIWLVTNVFVGGRSIVSYLISFLSPLASLMGLDGVTLSAFLLGIPANEIILPLALMMYTGGGALTSGGSYGFIGNILLQNGWSTTTALCAIVFFLMHWPCSTTLLTIKKESKSLKWTVVSFLLPTIAGITVCMIINFISYFIGLIL